MKRRPQIGCEWVNLEFHLRSLASYLISRLVVIIPVPVEKLAHSEFTKIGSRQEALRTIFPPLLNIFYHPNVGFF
jgi:hypothetical protein